MMSLRKAISYLKTLRISERDALVYIYLAKKGPLKEENLAYTLNLATAELHLSLKALLERGLIQRVHERATRYFAVPLEEILDERVRAANYKVKALLERKAALLDAWPIKKRQ